ncbi:MAG: TlpA family protein disulfide reductase [Gracilimonas sp.]|uniref:TlpA disulfide reductase family protein n=1 Tax=Gracilimonas sp. TaxID=1974203 RepID=UPI003752F549|nr:TlpA family protein disulfide reductase [Gracilimonas sp.]
MKYLILSGLLIFMAACGAKQGESQQTETKRVERLDPASAPLYAAQKLAQATDFEVTLLSGETFRLSGQKGNVVLMNIWATWCPPCREETPELEELYRKYKNEGYVTLGVSIDEQGESVVRPFMEEFNVTYPMYIDTDGTVMDKYGPTMGIPTTYIIGRQGKLRYFAVGAVSKKELEPRIKELLAER